MRKPGVLVALGVVCLMSTAALAQPPTQVEVTLSYEPQYQGPYLAYENPIVAVDVIIDQLNSMNGLSLWGVVTLDGQEQTDLMFDHAELHPNLLTAADGYSLIDVGTGQGMVSYNIAPGEGMTMETPGPDVTGAIATFYYQVVNPEAVGIYEFNLDSTWYAMVSAGTWSTRSYLSWGDGESANWVPFWTDFMGREDMPPPDDPMWWKRDVLNFPVDPALIHIVPEPGTIMLLGAGLMGLVALRRRR